MSLEPARDCTLVAHRPHHDVSVRYLGTPGVSSPVLTVICKMIIQHCVINCKHLLFLPFGKVVSHVQRSWKGFCKIVNYILTYWNWHMCIFCSECRYAKYCVVLHLQCRRYAITTNHHFRVSHSWGDSQRVLHMFEVNVLSVNVTIHTWQFKDNTGPHKPIDLLMLVNQVSSEGSRLTLSPLSVCLSVDSARLRRAPQVLTANRIKDIPPLPLLIQH